MGQWIGFDWDDGNLFKNWEKHRVAASECEQIFFNRPLVTDDERHSTREPRFYALGTTDAGRYLFVVFTFRRKRIRVSSVRDMNRRERKVYDAS